MNNYYPNNNNIHLLLQQFLLILPLLLLITTNKTSTCTCYCYTPYYKNINTIQQRDLYYTTVTTTRIRRNNVRTYTSHQYNNHDTFEEKNSNNDQYAYSDDLDTETDTKSNRCITNETITTLPTTTTTTLLEQTSIIIRNTTFIEFTMNSTTTTDAIININSNDNNNNTTITTTTIPNNHILTSIILLNIVAIIWGTQHAIIKTCVDDIDFIHSSISSIDYSIISDSTITNTNILQPSQQQQQSNLLIPPIFTFIRFIIASIIATLYIQTPNSLQQVPTNNSNDTQSHNINFIQNNGNGNVSSSTLDSIIVNQSPSMLSSSSSSSLFVILRWGLELGLYMFLGYSLQAIGLQSTTAQRSGFLLYLNVKFVPFLAYIFYQRPIRTITILSALTAFTGTGLLAYNPNQQQQQLMDTTSLSTLNENTFALSNLVSFNVGDLWSIAAAIASAMFILRLETASNAIMVETSYDDTDDVDDAVRKNASTNNNNNAVAKFNASSLWVVTVLALLWTIYVTMSSLPDDNLNVSTIATTIWNEIEILLHNHLWELIYLGGISTALANYIQTKAQRYISAERASIIYAMDPVYGAFFSYIILGETLNGITGWIGATLIVIAAATNAFLEGSKDNSK